MTTIKINLALQGGGAHGAFTWGVLDRLMEDEDIEVAAISGTSAGALNAAAFKTGWLRDKHAGARESLRRLWEQIGAINSEPAADWISQMTPAAKVWAAALEYSPAYTAFDAASRILSPYVFGPFVQNPLARIVREFSYDLVCMNAGPEIHICATNVRSGKIKVFAGEEITPDAILASACLPSLFQAVEIENPKTGKTEAYWDGGYTGNPALFPLFADHLPDDIMVVNINPLYRDEVPHDSQAIANRINEISFNTSLLRELRAIEFVHRLIANGKVREGAMKNVLVHMISDDALMNDLNVATKTIPTPVILSKLKNAGRAAADQFLADHKADLNKRGTVDLVEMFS